MGEGFLTYKGTVLPWHCDEMGHMNVMWYVGKFDEATRHFFHEIGVTSAYVRESRRGMAAVEQTIQYKRELLAGDVVSVYSKLLEIKDRTVRFAHEMHNIGSGEVAATTTLTGVHFDLTVRRACAFPDSIKEKAGALLG